MPLTIALLLPIRARKMVTWMKWVMLVTIVMPQLTKTNQIQTKMALVMLAAPQEVVIMIGKYFEQ